MQKGKSMQYAMAGVQMTPNVRMNVRSNVYVPDSEAGNDQESYRQPYYAAQRVEQPPMRLTVPYRVAIPFLAVLFLVFFGLVAGKLTQRMRLTNEIHSMESHIKSLNTQNQALEQDVLENRDQARISFLAQGYGMVAASGVDMVPIVAPETRPTVQNSLTGSSPLPGGHGMISGSR